MRGLPTRNGTDVIAFIVNGVHTFIGSIGLLLGKKRAKAAVALGPTGSGVPGHRIVRTKALCIIILRLIIGSSCQIIHRVKITYVTGHADVLPSDVEKAQFSQIVDEQVTQSDTFPRLLQCVFVAVNLRQNGTELHLQPSDYDKLAHSVAY